jgi:hypothetical protein
MTRRTRWIWFGFVALGFLSACGTTGKPCADAGDTSWIPPLKNNKRCSQKLIGEKWLNHGDYEERDAAGNLILKGQFEEGLKTGVWTLYNDTGQKVAEKTFEKNIEVSPRPSSGGAVR